VETLLKSDLCSELCSGKAIQMPWVCFLSVFFEPEKNAGDSGR
jgi:hypothetical protein